MSEERGHRSAAGRNRRLPEQYRLVVLLKDLEDLSLSEVARRLGLTIPAVKTRHICARDRKWRSSLGCGADRSRQCAPAMMAIITFTGTSTILITGLAVAALNVVVRRESSNIVEKQIQLVVQASRSGVLAILDHAGTCTAPLTNSGPFKPLEAHTDEGFPQAQTFLTAKGSQGVQSLLPGQVPAAVSHPACLPETGFADLRGPGGRLSTARNPHCCSATEGRVQRNGHL